jgi:hypothetical protein
VHARIFHFSGGVPAGMQRKEQPILIVVETRIDFILHVVRLAAELRAHVGNLYRNEPKADRVTCEGKDKAGSYAKEIPPQKRGPFVFVNTPARSL